MGSSGVEAECWGNAETTLRVKQITLRLLTALHFFIVTFPPLRVYGNIVNPSTNSSVNINA